MGLSLLNSALNIALIISILLKGLFINIAPNLNVSMIIILSSLSYFFMGMILTNYSYKEAKRSLISNVFNAFLFLLFLIIIINLPLNNVLIDSIKVFLKHNIVILKYIDISVLLILFVYFLTKFIFINIFDLISYLANRYIAFSMSIFISYIIEVIFLVTIIYLKDIININIEVIDLIKYLTASFITLISVSTFLIIVYSLIFINKKT